MPHLCFEISWEVFDFPTCHCFLRGFALRTGQGQVCPSCRASPRGSRRGTPYAPAARAPWAQPGSPPVGIGIRCPCPPGSSGPE